MLGIPGGEAVDRQDVEPPVIVEVGEPGAPAPAAIVRAGGAGDIDETAAMRRQGVGR